MRKSIGRRTRKGGYQACLGKCEKPADITREAGELTARFRRSYFGKGDLARSAAAEDERRRAERIAEKAVVKVELNKLKAADASVREFDRWIKLIVPALIATAGYRQHDRGQWRLRADVYHQRRKERSRCSG